MSVRAAPVTPTGFPSPVSEALPGAIERLVQGLQPEKIVLFGSYGYGDPTPDSDVEVGILVRTPAEIQTDLAGGDCTAASTWACSSVSRGGRGGPPVCAKAKPAGPDWGDSSSQLPMAWASLPNVSAT